MKKILILILFSLNANAFGGGSIDVDPSSEYINFGTVINNLIPMSIGAWIFANGAGGGNTGTIAYKRGNPGASGWRFGLNSNNGGSLQWTSDAATDSNYIAQNKIPFSKWIYVGMRWNGGYSSNNIDLLISTLTNIMIVEPTYTTSVLGVGPKVDDTANPLVVGTNWTVNTNGFDGLIADVKISSAFLSDSEFTQMMNCSDYVPPKLVASWPMWNAEGQFDLSGADLDGIPVGSITEFQNGPPNSICGGGLN